MEKGLRSVVMAVMLPGLGAGLAQARTNDPVVRQRGQNQEK